MNINTKKWTKNIKIALVSGLLVSSLAACGGQAEDIYQEGLGHHQDKEYVAAINNYNTVIEQYPESEFATKAKVKKEDAIDALIIQANQAYGSELYDKAVTLYETVLTYRPEAGELQKKLKVARTYVVDDVDVVAVNPDTPPEQNINVNVEQPDVNIQQPAPKVEKETVIIEKQTDGTTAQTNNDNPTRTEQAVNQHKRKINQADKLGPDTTDTNAANNTNTATQPKNSDFKTASYLNNGRKDCYSIQGTMEGSVSNGQFKEFPMNIRVCESTTDSSQVDGTATISWPNKGSDTTQVSGQVIPGKTMVIKQVAGDGNGRFNGQEALRGDKTLEGTFSFYDNSTPNFKWHAVWRPTSS